MELTAINFYWSTTICASLLPWPVTAPAPVGVGAGRTGPDAPYRASDRCVEWRKSSGPLPSAPPDACGILVGAEGPGLDIEMCHRRNRDLGHLPRRLAGGDRPDGTGGAAGAAPAARLLRPAARPQRRKRGKRSAPTSAAVGAAGTALATSGGVLVERLRPAVGQDRRAPR